MDLKKTLLNVFLWLAVIGMSLWVGGTVFSMSVVVPMWSETPPESVKAFFGGTSFNKYIFNFFGPPWMVGRNLPILIALILSWNSRLHRRYLLITFITFIAGVLYTLFYIYPINEVLMMQAGGNHSAEEIQKMVKQWVVADRLRFVVGFIGYIFLLKAFRLPIEKK
jgi:hypothetical protein